MFNNAFNINNLKMDIESCKYQMKEIFFEMLRLNEEKKAHLPFSIISIINGVKISRYKNIYNSFQGRLEDSLDLFEDYKGIKYFDYEKNIYKDKTL